MGLVAAGAVVLAFALELALAEPPTRVHPVVWLGRCIAPFDREWSHPDAVGGLVALVLPLGAAALAAGVVALAGRFGGPATAFVAGVVLFSASSLRMLLGEARAVTRASTTDIEGARANLRALAGRNASALSPGQVRSAAVESAAENLADGLVAPLLAFALLAPVSLPLAAGGATWVKAVNTLDSMLGYRSKPVGRVSARLDDAVMWIPARLSALLVALVARAPRTLWATSEWARSPPSPNSGWPMGALAVVLDVRLEKPDVYVLNPDAALPTADDATRGIRTVGVAGLLAYAGTGAVAWF